MEVDGSDDIPFLPWLVLRFQLLIFRGVNLQPLKALREQYVCISISFD